MSCLDKLKIITSVNNIKDIDKKIFQTNSIGGILQSYKYRQTKPSLLEIRVDLIHNELAIEFTSKILKDNFIYFNCLYGISKLVVFNVFIWQRGSSYCLLH